jgi:hypothetical protein
VEWSSVRSIALLAVAVAIGGCLLDSSEAPGECFDGGWGATWVQPGLYDFVSNRSAAPYPVETELHRATAELVSDEMARGVGADYRLTGAGETWPDDPETTRFYLAFGIHQPEIEGGLARNRVWAQFPSETLDPDVVPLAEAFFRAVLDDDSVAPSLAADLVGQRANYRSDETGADWYASLDFWGNLSAQRAYENRTTGPDGRWAGWRTFESAGRSFTISVSTLLLDGPDGRIKVDAGDHVTGPTQDWRVDSRVAAEAHTREAFATYGLPDPPLEGAEWAQGMVCPTSADA